MSSCFFFQAEDGIRDRNVTGVQTCALPISHLLDLEVVQVLRRLARQGVVPARRAGEAVQDLLDLRMTRYPHTVLVPQIWQLRHNFSAYDAAYIVLAEKLGAALITRDSQLASASSHTATIELF